MLKRFPRATAAIVTAGVLAAGGAIAASAHQLSGTSTFRDDMATTTRVEQPEQSPEQSPEMSEATSPRIVFVEPAPEPAETPEATETEAPETEAPDMDSKPATTAPKADSDRDGGHTGTTTSPERD